MKLTSSDGFTSIGCMVCNPIFGAMVQAATEAEAIAAWNTRAERTCNMIERGTFTPRHDFYRVECNMCGVMFFQTHGHFPRANYCPNCGAKVVEQ